MRSTGEVQSSFVSKTSDVCFPHHHTKTLLRSSRASKPHNLSMIRKYLSTRGSVIHNKSSKELNELVQAFNQEHGVKVAEQNGHVWEAFSASSWEVRAKFEAFLETRFSVESLHFVEDVEAYTLGFFEKGDTWKLSKAKQLCEKYIHRESTFAVNISEAEVHRILQQMNQAESTKSTRGLERLFEKAVRDILANMMFSQWMEFKQQMDRENISTSRTLSSLTSLSM